MKKVNYDCKGTLGIGGVFLQLPCFFPSVSSIKTNLPLLEYLKVLIAFKCPLFLVSAYDVYNCEKKQASQIRVLLREVMANGKIVLLDSGNYESYWKDDKKWTAVKYRNILRNTPHNLSFCFDSLLSIKKIEDIALFIERQVLEDQRCSQETVVPIIHSLHKEDFPEIISQVVDKLSPIMLAIPERELGEGILERAETIYRIRKALSKKKSYYPLHLLGTGNPLSILIYSICGADSFDGLEWCQTAVNHETGLLYHFQQRDFFGAQTIFCNIKGFPYTQATLAHNLQFYIQWMDQIQENIGKKSMNSLVNKYIPKLILDSLKKRFPESFHD